MTKYLLVNEGYCPKCNRILDTTSAYCPICEQPEVKHIELEDGSIECPSCRVCKGYSIYGGEHLGYPSKYDGEFICADCLAKFIDEVIDDLEIAKKSQLEYESG